jgi:Ulp1 family protease
VPVHSGLHWSLVIICHAGAVPPQSAPAAVIICHAGAVPPQSAPAAEEIIDVDGPARAPPRAVDPAPGSPVTQEDVQAAAPCAPDDPSVMDVDAAKPAEEDVTAMLAAGAEQPSAAASALLPSILHLDSMGGGHSTCACITHRC